MANKFISPERHPDIIIPEDDTFQAISIWVKEGLFRIGGAEFCTKHVVTKDGNICESWSQYIEIVIAQQPQKRKGAALGFLAELELLHKGNDAVG